MDIVGRASVEGRSAILTNKGEFTMKLNPALITLCALGISFCAQSVTYVPTGTRGDAVFTYFNSSIQTTATYTYDRARFYTASIPLGKDSGCGVNQECSSGYNIEWIDAGADINLPDGCVMTTKADLQTYLWGIPYKRGYRDLSDGPSMRIHIEPVNYTYYNRALHIDAPTLDCNRYLGRSVTVPWNGFLNVQKWWDGVTPNVSYLTVAGTIVYTTTGQYATIELSPSIIDIMGTAGSSVITETEITIKSDSKVRLSGPAVVGVQYFNESSWADELNMDLSAIDEQGRTISVKLKVTDGQPGRRTYSIPFTVTVLT